MKLFEKFNPRKAFLSGTISNDKVRINFFESEITFDEFNTMNEIYHEKYNTELKNSGHFEFNTQRAKMDILRTHLDDFVKEFNIEVIRKPYYQFRITYGKLNNYFGVVYDETNANIIKDNLELKNMDNIQIIREENIQ
jgi:hypothetical protein